MSLARKGASVFFSTWLLLPLQIITSVLIVRVLGAEGKGVLVILTTSVGLLAMLGSLGLPAAGLYFLRSGTYTERTLIANYLVVVAVVSLAAFGLAVGASDFFVAAFLEGVRVSPGTLGLALAVLPFAMVNGFISTLLLAKGQTREYAWLTVGGSALSLIGTLLLVVWLRLGVAGALAASLLAQLIISGERVWSTLRTTRGQVCQLHGRILWAMLKFGIQHYLGTLGSQMFKRFDSFLLAYFLDVRAVGYYSVAVTAYETVLRIPRAVNCLLAGEASGQAARKSSALVARTARNVLWLMTGLSLLLMGLSPWLVPMFYGPDFVQSVPPLWVLLGAAVLIGFASTLQAYFLGIGKPGINGMFTLVAGLVNLGLSLWLIPTAGILGNAAATWLGSLVSVILHLTWFVRLARVPVRSTCLLSPQDVSAWLRGLQHGLRHVRIFVELRWRRIRLWLSFQMK